MTLLLAAMFGLPTAVTSAGAGGKYTLHYVDAGSFDPPPPAAAEQAAHRRRRLQRPEIPFWMKAATFDSGGGLLSDPVNVTKPFNGMGYLSIAADGSKAIFASELKQPQGWSNVDTYVMALDPSTGAAVSAGLGRIVALYYCSSALYYIHEHIRRLFF